MSLAVETKLIELRDSATFIPCIATRVCPFRLPINAAETYLIRRAGYDYHHPMVLFGRLDGSGKHYCDPRDWGDRTFATAHLYVYELWNDITSGDVVDVQYILKETLTPKVSERSDPLTY